MSYKSQGPDFTASFEERGEHCRMKHSSEKAVTYLLNSHTIFNLGNSLHLSGLGRAECGHQVWLTVSQLCDTSEGCFTGKSGCLLKCGLNWM